MAVLVVAEGLNDGAGGDNSSGRDAGVNEGRK